MKFYKKWRYCKKLTNHDVLAEMAILPKPLKPFAEHDVLCKMAELPKTTKPFAHGGFLDGFGGHE